MTFIPSYANIDSPDPVNVQDLATKHYVDTVRTAVVARAPVAATTISGLTIVPLGTATFDTLSGFTIATGIYTCKQAGYYQVNASLRVTSVPTANGPNFQTQKNGATYGISSLYNAAAGAQFVSFSLSDIMSLAVNDVVRMAVGNTGGSVVAGDGALSLVWLGS